MRDYYQQLAAIPSSKDFLKVLEADIQHANMLAASIARDKSSACLQMKLVHIHLAPLLLFLLQCMDCSCTCLLSNYFNPFHIIIFKVHADGKPNISYCRRKATIREFYGVILPSLQRLHCDSYELDTDQEGHSFQIAVNRTSGDERKPSDVDLERENECGICLESCTKMVLPDCCHAMCVNCYHDWSTRSESCPFCRRSLKTVNSRDLWILTCSSDVADVHTVLREDLSRFSLFINSLPKNIPDVLFSLYHEYLF